MPVGVVEPLGVDPVADQRSQRVDQRLRWFSALESCLANIPPGRTFSRQSCGGDLGIARPPDAPQQRNRVAYFYE